MPKFEIIICPKSEVGEGRKKEGDIFAIRPAGWKWGKIEKTRYLIVPATLTNDESKFLETAFYENGKTKAETLLYENEKLSLTFSIFQKYAIVVSGKYIIPPESLLNYQSEIMDLNSTMPDISIINKHRYKFPLTIIKNKYSEFNVNLAQDLSVNYQPFLDDPGKILIDTSINEPLFYDKHIEGFQFIPEKEIPLEIRV